MYTEIKDVPSGYPTVAALISKDNDFAIFRKFRYLNARNLLYLQAELIDLENELETVDRSLEIKNETEELKSWKNFAKDEVRRDLALRIRKTLDEYNKALLQVNQMAGLPSPTKHMAKIFDKWITGWEHISDSSSNYLESTIPRGTGPLQLRNFFKGVRYWMNHRRHINTLNRSPESAIPRGTIPLQKGKGPRYSEDNSELATISRRPDSWLGRFLKRTPLKFVFIEDKVRFKTGGFLVFYPGSKVETVVGAISIIFAVALTVIAVVALGMMPQQQQAARLGLVGLFTLLVAGVLAVSGARKAEVLMGTIGYVAILVVFVVGQQSG